MIIKLKGADFSANNIGTLSTYSIRFVGSGVTNSNTSVDRKSNTGYTTTITLGADYELNGSITVTMGGTDITSTAVSGLTITIPTKVTGNVVITVPTKNTVTGEEEEPETPVNPTPGGNNYIDITTQGNIKGSIKDSVINQSDSSSLYLLTKVQLPANAVSVEYQAFKTGGSFGSAFADNSNTVVKFLPKTNITTGERVTETVPSGATYFWHMWDDPNETDKQNADAFTYIRIYTSGESGGGGSAEGLPVRITVQTQDNNKMLDVSTGQITALSDDGTGAQTITVCQIPSGATTVNYQMFKTGKNYGSGFFNGSTFISGHANNSEDSGTRKTLTIPSGATEFWHMYPNRVYANSGLSTPEFDYIEFA